MDEVFYNGLVDELIKIAVVPRAVKDYRRALTALEEGVRSVDPATGEMMGGQLFHHAHPKKMEMLAEEGALRPTAPGHHAQHGPGIYWGKGTPAERGADAKPYFSSIMDEGVITPRRAVVDPRTQELAAPPKELPPRPNIETGKPQPRTYAVTEGRYEPRPKDIAVIDMATRAKNKKTRDYLMADLQDMRMRTIDSATFQKARKSMAQNLKTRQLMRAGKPSLPSVPTPSKASLVKSHGRRLLGLLK